MYNNILCLYVISPSKMEKKTMQKYKIKKFTATIVVQRYFYPAINLSKNIRPQLCRKIIQMTIVMTTGEKQLSILVLICTTQLKCISHIQRSSLRNDTIEKAIFETLSKFLNCLTRNFENIFSRDFRKKKCFSASLLYCE